MYPPHTSFIPALILATSIGWGTAAVFSALVFAATQTHGLPFRPDLKDSALQITMTVAAMFEGALISYSQARVLHRILPGLTVVTWVASGVVAAASGSVLSGLPTSFALTALLTARTGDTTTPAIMLVSATAVTGVVSCLPWVISQFVVLRAHGVGARRWLVPNVMAWAVTFPLLYMAAVVPDRTVRPLFAIAGTLMGVVMGWAQARALCVRRKPKHDAQRKRTSTQFI